MTIMAGILRRDGGTGIPPEMRARLAGALSRTPGDVPVVFEDDSCLLAKVDTDAIGSPAHLVDTDGAVSFLVGDPVLPGLGAPNDRVPQLSALHRGWSSGDWDGTVRARGVFCAAHYDPRRRVLTVVTDRLGIRPVYWYCDDRLFVFATALRIVEAFSEVRKTPDLRGVTELSALGFCLGTRTPYKGISLLRSAQMLHVSPSACQEHTYWKWDAIETSDEPEDRLADRAYLAFKEAVSVRLDRGRVAHAFLSGGLDSRAIVAMLHQLGADLRTYNFSRIESQDQVFARRFAERLGLDHEEHPRTAPGPLWLWPIADALKRQNRDTSGNRIAWSGDGGSVGLGLVYMTPEVVNALRAGDVHLAAGTFLRQSAVSLPKRLLTRSAAKELEGVLEAGIEEELSLLKSAEPGRAFYHFLMANDQRRHLARHFEEIDVHRVEFSLPFFDAPFLEVLCSVPVDWCLAHKFYMTWLGRFPPSTTSVPWQTYPGHLRCPLPSDETLGYQWSRTWQGLWGIPRRSVAALGVRLACSPTFPADVLRRGTLLTGAVLHLLGLRDFAYLVNFAEVYHRYSPAAVQARERVLAASPGEWNRVA